MNRPRRLRVLAAVVGLLTVAGCSGVPGSSAPDVVRTIGLGESPQPSPAAPQENASPRDIVTDLFDVMGSSPDRLDAARAYMDEDAAQKWAGNTVTVIRDNPLQFEADAASNTVKVTYQPVGTLSADGVYRPATLEGVGTGSPQTTTYSVGRNRDGQWRIDGLVPPGLYVSDTDFEQRFTPKALYFFDAAGKRLVPDLRYSALTESSLETYLLNQLAAGPRPELEGAVSPFDPVPTGNQRLSVTPGSPTVVQVPGAAALDDQSRTQLAAQVAFTLPPTSFRSELQIQDGTQVVTVPGVGSTFDVADFGDLGPVDDDTDVSATYVHNGGVVDSSGAPLPGVFGAPKSSLDSAVFDSDGGRTLLAGTTGPDGPEGKRRLLVGDVTGLVDVGVPAGPLTPPAWAPVGTSSDVDEVWVASGGQIYRYVPGQRGAKPTTVSVAGQNIPAGTITSLAFSPEGARVVLVIRGSDGRTSQVWLASVVRNGPGVQLAQLERVTPSGYDIADAGWRTETSLAAVGTSATFPGGLYLVVAVDGSRIEAGATEGLPDQPRTLAVSPASSAQWATVGTGADATVYSRATSLAAWAPPSGTSPVSGSAPSFTS